MVSEHEVDRTIEIFEIIMGKGDMLPAAAMETAIRLRKAVENGAPEQCYEDNGASDAAA